MASLDDAFNERTQLLKKKDEIKNEKPKISDMKILNPSDDSDWKMIKYYNRMYKKVKDSFKAHTTMKDIIEFEDVGPSGPKDNVLGIKWHKLLKDRIEEKWKATLSEEKKTEETSKGSTTEKTESEKNSKGTELKNEKENSKKTPLLPSLKSHFGIEVLVSDFPLYGFMCSENELQPEPYFWRGDADAIGLFYNEKRERNEYVIIDWKLKKDLLYFWKSSETYGMYLHQCLVYAKLFQLHMNLDYLPSILLVPISSDNWQDMYPAHFLDYPDECKKKIDEDYTWTTEIPSSSPKIYLNEQLFKTKDIGELEEGLKLNDIFKSDAKVGDLMKALSMEGGSLKVIPKKQEDD